MCGRFALTASPEEIAAIFDLLEVDVFPPRYNIAPTQPVMIVCPSAVARSDGSNLPDRQAVLMRWGLIPSWVRDPGKFPLLINARAETAATKNSFRAAMRHRRALLPASGFYEWRREGGRTGQPYWVRPKRGGVVAFAALWETWLEPGGAEIDTAAILTTTSNGVIATIHDRMPVVIEPRDFGRWLDCLANEPRDVADLLGAPDPDFFEAIPVSTLVNKVANMGPEVQRAVDPSGSAGGSATEKKPSSPEPPRDDPQLRLL